MNNNMYTNPSYIPSQGTAPPNIGIGGSNQELNSMEYASDIIRKNVGKKVKIYVSFSDSIEWRDSLFEGIIEESGRDYVLVYNQNTKERYLIWSVYINYIVFEEQLNRGY